MMNVYQSQAKTKSFNNTDMPAKGVLKRRVDHRLKASIQYLFPARNHPY